MLARPETAEHVQAAVSNFLIDLSEDAARVQAVAGLAVDGQNNETVFVIDADFYTEQQTEPSDVFQRLNTLNRYARHFFHWCITDRLHQALHPDAVAPD